MEGDKDDGEHDPRVLVDVAAPHPEHGVGRVHQVGLHWASGVGALMMVTDVHRGHQRHLVMAVLTVVGIGPGVIVKDDVVLTLLPLIAVVAVLLLMMMMMLYLDTCMTSSMLIQKSLHGQEPVPMQLDPLVSVADTGVLDQGPEHHEEADEEVDVDALHVGDLGQGRVDRVAEGGHGQHSGHPQAHPGGGRPPVEPE